MLVVGEKQSQHQLQQQEDKSSYKTESSSNNNNINNNDIDTHRGEIRHSTTKEVDKFLSTNHMDKVRKHD
jgi:hypothetical protein